VCFSAATKINEKCLLLQLFEDVNLPQAHGGLRKKSCALHARFAAHAGTMVMA
jgi:hypothetical protein